MKKNKLKLKDAISKEKRHWVRITSVCNNNCLFCLDKDNQNGTIIPFQKIVSEFEKGLLSGAKRVIISGGDPTIHPDIFKIIKKANSMGYNHVQMISNGRMLAYNDFAKKLKESGLDEITISMHSHIKEKLEKMTQIKGSYDQAMRGLINALKYKFIVSVDIVINKINYKTLGDSLKFFIKLGVSEFDLLYVIPFGSAWENRKKLFFSPEKAKKYLDKAFELSNNPDLFIWTNRLPAIFLEGYEHLIQNPIKLKDEVSGMQKEFEAYVFNNKERNCKGERCEYCFMKDFCGDLETIKKEGELRSKTEPVCISKKRIKKNIFKLDEKFDIYKFLDFYIQHRYFVKSLRCIKCRYNNDCSGAHIEKIRKEGFKILKPIKN